MVVTVVDRICKKCNKNITNTHKTKACIAEMYLNCMEITEGRTDKNPILLDLFNDFVISIIVGIMENIDDSLAKRNEMFETVLSEIGFESNVPLPLILVGHEVEEEDVQILYSMANDWRGTNFWRLYMEAVNQASENCTDFSEGDAEENEACSLYANRLGFEFIDLSRDFAFEIEGILKDKFPAESFDDVADNYISDVISKLMNRLGVSKVGR